MRIAFVAYDWPGYRGGPIVNARRLLPELQRRGHQVHALIQYHRGGSPTADLLRAQGVQVHAVVFHRWTEDRIDWLLERLRAIGPDVFVPNLSVAGWYAARWAREAGIPTIAAYRSDDAFHAGMVEEFVLGDPRWAVSGLISVSQAAHDRILATDPARTRLCVIPSGVPVPSAAADQADGPLRLVYVGRLVQEQKRILETIDALAAVLHRLPDATAMLIGHCAAAPDEATIDARIKGHGLGDRLALLGTLEPDALHDVLRRFHVLVLLSDYEGTPGSVMDGMACGLVPVCLDIPGGVRELVRHEQTGLLVADRGDAFVDAVSRLAHDGVLRRRLATNARRHIRQGYSLEVAADRWEAFLAQLVEENPVPRTTIARPADDALPPVNPGLAREDHRRPLPPPPRPLWRRVLGGLRRRLRPVRLLQRGRPPADPSAAFLAPRCEAGNLDRYLIRRSILDALHAQRDRLRGTLLDVGCGQMPYKSILTAPAGQVTRYLGLDFADNPIHDNQPDLCWQDGRIPLEDAGVDCALCTEVLEHCPEPELVLREIARVLRSGGVLFLTVPFLWPLHEVPYDHYRYTPFALRRHLEQAGFGDIELHATGGWDASLAQMLGLWVRRRPMSTSKRQILSWLLLPIYRWLARRDALMPVRFQEGVMLTGVWGTAVKHETSRSR
ncbi:hypothetical protein CKO25_10610 [Thiocapsa imhoffii]|uniref:Glycosyltransferase n=1 Tax=Thiocapsa imhoffii TaxID=382777 RepID=A0A9X1B9H8_9GAMM|nr:glycosyltransferase [Thiocapsa imhoffii]MBK1645095.1 hypothetical protein [Thiocapsa imhoffii]